MQAATQPRNGPPSDGSETTAASLRRFRAFHATLQAIKDALRNGNWTALLTEPVTDGAIDQQLLLAVRTRLIAEINPSGHPIQTGEATDLDPSHVMAVIADDTLLHDVVWPGQQGWAREPLQKILFGAADDSDHHRRCDRCGNAGDAAQDDATSTIRLALGLGYLSRPSEASQIANVPRAGTPGTFDQRGPQPANRRNGCSRSCFARAIRRPPSPMIS